MRLWPFGRKANGDVLSIDQVIKRWDAIYSTSSGISVTAENCEQSPTVKAIVTAVTRRFAAMPVHVYLKTTSAGRTKKEIQPNHPVERLLNSPNEWLTHVDYWTDAASRLLRYGNYYAFKARGVTGPIRFLQPLHPSCVDVYQEQDLSVEYRTKLPGGQYREFTRDQIHHARMAARDGLKGDSPVGDVSETIALEIASEKFGATFFGNGAVPGVIFQFQENSAGFSDEAQQKRFIESFREQYNMKGRFKAMLLPKGMDTPTVLPIDNDKAQFIELRMLQRTIIAGAFGVPPHLVGDLSKGTFNNVEMQSTEFSTNVILPLCRIFEAAMEKDLLTQDDRNRGIIIRFNPDAILRADFKSRQEGQAIMRQNGVISPNEWRENEGMNPRTDDGGDDYFEQGPSGQTPMGASEPANNNNNNGNSDES